MFLIKMWWRSRHCPHSNLRGIYGDEIIARGFFRLECEDCQRRLDGPVSLAKHRRAEKELYEGLWTR